MEISFEIANGRQSWIFSFIILLSAPNWTGAQVPSKYKISIEKCFSIDFPEKSVKVDTLNLILYKTAFNSNEYQVLYSKVKVNTKHLRAFDLALKGYIEGYYKSKQMRGYKNIISDTVWNGTRGKFISSTKGDSSTGYLHFYNFLTNIQGHFFSIMCATNCGDLSCDNGDIMNFYHSMLIDPSCINNQLDEDEQYNKFYRIGQEIARPALLILLVMISLLVVQYFRKRP